MGMRSGRRSRRIRGTVLVVLSGILGLMLVMSMSFIMMVRVGRSASSRGMAQVAAILGCSSCSEYAFARLGRMFAASASASLPADNPFARPAFDRGEAWLDADGDGAWEPGEAYVDRDADGERDAFTGRLRGPLGGPLRMELGLSACGICVNDPGAGMGSLLDQLGSILAEASGDPSSFGAFESPVSGGGEPIRWSDLGRRIVAGRPPAGYRSYGELESRAALTAAETDFLRPYVTLERLPNPLDLTLGSGVLFLNGASPEILEAIWRYRFTRGGSRVDPLPSVPPTDPRTGLPFSEVVVIAKDEARSAAAAVWDRLRSMGPIPRWEDLYGLLDARRSELFPSPLAGSEGRGYEEVRINLLFHAIQPNRYPYWMAGPTQAGRTAALMAPWSWGRWPQGTEERLAGAANLYVEPPPLPAGAPYAASPYLGGAPAQAPDIIAMLGLPPRWTVRAVGTMASSVGASRVVETETMEVELLRSVYLTTQEDFENLYASAPPHGFGKPRALPGMNQGVTVEGRPSTRLPGSAERQVQSLPLFDQDAFHHATAPKYDRDSGALAPAEMPLPALVPETKLEARFAETGAGPLPETDANDNASTLGAVDMLAPSHAPFVRKSMKEMVDKGVSNPGSSAAPFWAFMKPKMTGMLSDGRWTFRPGKPFPGEVKQGVWTFSSFSQACLIGQLRTGTIECWVAEGTDGATEGLEEIWAIRVVPSPVPPPPPPGWDPLLEPILAAPHTMGLKLRRVKVAPRTWEYQVVWYGPWPKLSGGVIVGGEYSTGFAPPDGRILIRAVPAEPATDPCHARFRHVALLLFHNPAAPTAGDGMKLYIDGELRDTGTETWKSMYPIPLRWNLTAGFVGLLADPGNPGSPNAQLRKMWDGIWNGVPNNRRIDAIHDVLVNVQGVSHLQVHNRRLTGGIGGELEARCIRRFLPAAAYRSPRYRLPAGGTPVRPAGLGWTGILPTDPATRSPVPGHSMELEATFYDIAGNPLPGCPVQIPPEGLDLGFLPREAVSFDFSVRWDCTGVPRLVDPPVFEDLLLQYQIPPRRLR